MSILKKIGIAIVVLILVLALAAWWIMRGSPAELSVAAVTGTDPTLVEPNEQTIPTVDVAKPIGWKAGEAPKAAAGLTVNRFAEGLEHPRVIYLLPNGDLLVAETNAPARVVAGGGITNFVAGILFGLGVPNMMEFQRNGAMSSTANELVTALLVARSEAIKRQSSVSICASASPADPEPACGGASFSGYITFVDIDGDCARSGGEKVLRADGPLDRTVIANSNGSCLSFGANGFSRVAAAPTDASHILFCDSQWGTEVQSGGNLSAARGVLVSQTGRMEIVRDKKRIDEWDISCAR